MPGAAEHLDRILAEAREAIAKAESSQGLAEIRSGFLGKKGSVSGVLRGIGFFFAFPRLQKLRV